VGREHWYVAGPSSGSVQTELGKKYAEFTLIIRLRAQALNINVPF